MHISSWCQKFKKESEKSPTPPLYCQNLLSTLIEYVRGFVSSSYVYVYLTVKLVAMCGAYRCGPVYIEMDSLHWRRK